MSVINHGTMSARKTEYPLNTLAALKATHLALATANAFSGNTPLAQKLKKLIHVVLIIRPDILTNRKVITYEKNIISANVP